MARPKLFKTKKELEAKISGFWAYCEEKGVTPTLSRLAVFLDCTRRTLVNYSNEDQFFPTIEKVKAMIESYQEEFLYSGKSVAGAIFSLKNNYGWEDKHSNENINKEPDNPFSKLSKDELIELYKSRHIDT